jgi:RNA polymerases N / 8 kDa subunit
MDQLGLNRYCCRRMIMTHVDLIEKLLKYVYKKLERRKWAQWSLDRYTDRWRCAGITRPRRNCIDNRNNSGKPAAHMDSL